MKVSGKFEKLMSLVLRLGKVEESGMKCWRAKSKSPIQNFLDSLTSSPLPSLVKL